MCFFVFAIILLEIRRKLESMIVKRLDSIWYNVKLATFPLAPEKDEKLFLVFLSFRIKNKNERLEIVRKFVILPRHSL